MSVLMRGVKALNKDTQGSPPCCSHTGDGWADGRDLGYRTGVWIQKLMTTYCCLIGKKHY